MVQHVDHRDEHPHPNSTTLGGCSKGAAVHHAHGPLKELHVLFSLELPRLAHLLLRVAGDPYQFIEVDVHGGVLDGLRGLPGEGRQRRRDHLGQHCQVWGPGALLLLLLAEGNELGSQSDAPWGPCIHQMVDGGVFVVLDGDARRHGDDDLFVVDALTTDQASLILRVVHCHQRVVGSNPTDSVGYRPAEKSFGGLLSHDLLGPTAPA
mmetsp:Transcript_8217/g.14688  ORF Transcript_8217/g.14688 Transcript_8217/m.14688 type:complete len:208 (-) Transcript_8217:36-659(-)